MILKDKILKILTVHTLLIIITIFSLLLFYFSVIFTTINCSNDCELIIEKGESIYLIGEKVKDMGLISSSSSLVIASKLLFLDRSIKTGKYDLSNIDNMRQLLEYLTIPKDELLKVTIPEGWDLNRIASRLAETDLVDFDKFLQLCHDKKFINLYNNRISHLEGFLYPETYLFSVYSNEEQIINQMLSQYFSVAGKLMKNVNHYNLSSYDILILASIIQGEARAIDEMPIISSVFHNRLRDKIPLEANATIQYIIPGKNRRLWEKDLKMESPYNTYTNFGLPPTPINNPGIDAIKAAINPEITNYYFFVADPENPGRHVFNEDLNGHLRAKRKYLKSLK